jgi:hypothetical protein
LLWKKTNVTRRKKTEVRVALQNFSVEDSDGDRKDRQRIDAQS